MNCPHRLATVGEPTPNRETSELARLSTYNNKIMSEESSSLELPRCEGGRPTGETNYFECTCPKECPRHGKCCA